MNEHARTASTTDELRYRLRQHKLLSDFGVYCLRTHDVAALLDEAARASAAGMQCELSKVLEYRPAHDDFLVVAGVGWRPGVVGHALLGPGDESPAGLAFATGRPVVSNELAAEKRFRTPQLLLEHGVKSASNVLIRGEDSPFGVLEIDSTRSGTFDAADTDFLQGFANLLGVAIERQHLDEHLRRKERALQQALAHERVLAAEVHHRVKNSLALVAGLLTLQGRGTVHEESRRLLRAAEMRIQAIAEVHDHLARHGKVTTVPLDAFVGDLCRRLRAANPLHDLCCDVVACVASADRAIALGLLINELVTNALKYAYPHGGGEIRVSVRSAGDGRYCLVVSDKGAGMPDDATKPRGLGTKVVTSLARQLGGTVAWQSANPGTRVVVEFPEEA